VSRVYFIPLKFFERGESNHWLLRIEEKGGGDEVKRILKGERRKASLRELPHSSSRKSDADFNGGKGKKKGKARSTSCHLRGGGLGGEAKPGFHLRQTQTLQRKGEGEE